MAREKASRKWQITINNPLEHDFPHDTIKAILASFPSALYWCLCDEIGEQGTPHTHIYVVFKNAVMFSTMQQRFRALIWNRPTVPAARTAPISAKRENGRMIKSMKPACRKPLRNGAPCLPNAPLMALSMKPFTTW